MMITEKDLSEKALKYAQSKYYQKKPDLVYPVASAYTDGYRQAQQDNPLRWRDPKKELPECLPGIGSMVLAAVRHDRNDDFPLTDIVWFYDQQWRRWDVTKQFHVKIDKSLIAAWMPLPGFRIID